MVAIWESTASVSRILPKSTSLQDWVNIPSGDLAALKVALFEEGPISVGIDASHPSFAFYNQGVSFDTEFDCFIAAAFGYRIYLPRSM